MEGIGAFGVVFGLVGLLFAAGGATMAVVLVRRMMIRSRALSNGLQAEARCLEVYQSRSSEGASTRHVILGFTTREGREVRFEPPVAPLVVVGDFVQVRYLAERPEQAAVVGAGSAAGVFGLVVALVFCAVFVLVGLGFAAAGFGFGFFAFGAGSTDPSTLPDGWPTQ